MLSIAKLQNLKAIHNLKSNRLLSPLVVINRKTTKFESNSQRSRIRYQNSLCCYQSQNYKIWKQFTTKAERSGASELLLSIAKLQNLKAIHNSDIWWELRVVVVINRKTTKFESNSQHCLSLWSKTILLLSIAKLQNLKAIHNKRSVLYYFCVVVINRKTTKFESNSQLHWPGYALILGCYQSQNYKIWKQFTTITWRISSTSVLLSIAKLQNLKAIHNEFVPHKQI